MTEVGKAAMNLAHALARLAAEERKFDGKDRTALYRRRVQIVRHRYYEACRNAGKEPYEIGCQTELPWIVEDDNETLT